MKFVKYRITWKFTDEGDDCRAEFYLPEGADPHKDVGALINLVELSASEYGYAYNLEVIAQVNIKTPKIMKEVIE